MSDEDLIKKTIGSAVHYNLLLKYRYIAVVAEFIGFTKAVNKSYSKLTYSLLVWVILACIATNIGLISFTSLLFNIVIVLLLWVFLYILKGYSIGCAAVKYCYQQGVLGRDHVIKQLVDKQDPENSLTLDEVIS